MRQKTLVSLLVLAVAVLACGQALVVQAADISGAFFGYYDPSNPNLQVDQGPMPLENNNMVADTGLGWYMGYDYYPWTYDININGFHLTQDTGGGNPQSISGALTGSSGTYTYVGGDYAPSYLTGSTPNTFAGTYEIYGHTTGLILQKDPGVAAISGPVVLQYGVLAWGAANQVANAPSFTLALGASEISTMRLNGFSDTIGGLQTSGGPGNAIVENNSGSANTSTLNIVTGVGTSYNFAGTIQDEPATAGHGSTLALNVGGSGVQILSGTNTYSGGTTVSGGTLALNSSLPNAAISVTGGAFNGSGTISFLDGNTISVGSAGTFDASGGMQWNLDALTSLTPVTLLDYTSGGSFLAPGTLNSLLAPSSIGSWSLTNSAGEVIADPILNYAWKVDHDGNWNDSNNWITGVPNAIDGKANFLNAITAPRTVTVDGPVTVGTIKFNSAFAYTIAGSGANTITLDTSGADAAITSVVGSHTIAAPLLLNKPVDVTVLQSTDTLTVSGDISELSVGMGMTKVGAGTLLLSGNNSFTGPVLIKGGTLQVSGGNALAPTVDVTIVSAAFDLNGSSQAIGTLTSSGTVAMNGGTLTLTTVGASNTISGLTGAGQVTVADATNGTTTLSHNGGFSGNMTINNGTISADLSTGGFGDGTGTATLNNTTWSGFGSTNENFHIAGGTAEFDDYGGSPVLSGNVAIDTGATMLWTTGGGNNGVITGGISGGGSFVDVGGPGGGGFEFSPLYYQGTAANTLSGTTYVNQGTLTLQKPDGVDAIAGPLTIGDGTDTAHVILAANEQINNAVVVTIAANSDLRLMGFNETIGGLVSNPGEGAVANYGTTGSTLTIAPAASTNNTFGGSLIDGDVGPLTLVVSGSGSQTLSGVNTFTGGTFVTGGTLILTSNTALADGSSLTVGDPGLFASPAAAAGVSVSAVPEPGTLALLAAAAMGAALYCQRRKRKVSVSV